MTPRKLAALLVLSIGFAVNPAAHAGLGFAFLTQSPLEINGFIDMGSAEQGEQLLAATQTLTADVDGITYEGIRITSIEIPSAPEVTIDYIGTCLVNTVLFDGDDCDITVYATSDVPGTYGGEVNIGCTPILAVGTISMVDCALSLPSPAVYSFFNVMAEFTRSIMNPGAPPAPAEPPQPVPVLGGGVLTTLCLLVLALGSWAGFRRR